MWVVAELIDMLVLLVRIDTRVAIPTSVMLMAFTSALRMYTLSASRGMWRV